jgi:hypothetical protein
MGEKDSIKIDEDSTMGKGSMLMIAQLMATKNGRK